MQIVSSTDCRARMTTAEATAGLNSDATVTRPVSTIFYAWPEVIQLSGLGGEEGGAEKGEEEER